MMEICLVNMPYTPIERPSIALGLLQARLMREGLTAETVYADLLFADDIGLQRHRLISAVRPQDPLGDWTFAHIAFPGYEPDREAFLERLIERDQMFDGCDMKAFTGIMLQVRSRAERLVDRLIDQILDQRPGIVGCSSTYMQHVASLALLRRLRDAAPETITLMGGANCETIMGRTTHEQFPWVDYVVSGEADELIVPLVQQIRDHGRGVPSEALPAGVFAPAHRSEGYPAARDGLPLRATVDALDDQPPPAYDDYFRTLNTLRSRDRIRTALPIESSRGCWWGQRKSCRYCSLSGCGKRFRSRPAHHVLHDLETLAQRHGVHRFLASDNALEMGFLKTLFPRLAQHETRYRLYYQIMPNLNRAQIRTVREGRMSWLWAGIESLHDGLLTHMSKACKAWQNIQFLKWCREAGVYVGWYIMCDFPGEDDAWYGEMADLLPLLTHLQPPWALARVRLDRFSHYHEHASEAGMNLYPAELYRSIYPVRDKALRDLVYFFEDDARRRNPMLADVLERPGIRATSRAAARWKLTFWSGNRAGVFMDVTDSVIEVQDTRPIAVRRTFSLEGLDRELYLACDAATRERDLMDGLQRDGVTGGDVKAALRRLTRDKLMIETGGRYLALAVQAPAPDLPGSGEYPGGAVMARPEQLFRPGLENGASAP